MRFADVVGNRHVKDLLLRTGRRNRVPHAFLFHGPEGVGKRTMALAFFSWLVCPNRSEEDSCGECIVCRQVSDGSYVDLGILRPEKGYIRIENFRQAVPRLFFEPVVGQWKCLLIDDAHMMTLEAANAALKTLEEPPSATLFFLITSAPDTLPRTVVSRCFSIPFGPVPVHEVASLLERLGKGNAVAAAARSRGSPGRALRLCESESLGERTALVNAMLDAISAGAEGILRFSEEATRDRNAVEGHMEIIESVLKDMLMLSADLKEGSLSNPDMAERIKTVTDKIGTNRVLDMIYAWIEWDLARRYSPSARLALYRMMPPT